MHRPVAIALTAAAIALAGCAAAMPVGKPSVDMPAEMARSAEFDTHPSTRADVHAKLGEPWLASEALGVEVYRLQGKQHNVLVVFAPWPVPVPNFSDKLEVYTLVVYDADGRVAARASGFAQAPFPEPSTVILRAGEFEFVHELRDTLSVSLDRYRQLRAASAAGPACTVLAGCDGAPAAEVGANRYCICMANLVLDDGKPRVLTMARPAVIPRSRISEADCLNSGPGYSAFGSPGSGACVYTSHTLYPLSLAPGSHRLRFSLKAKDPGAAVELACRSGEVNFATLGGKFMSCTGAAGQSWTDTAAASETLSLGLEPPASGLGLRVLVYDNGEWLFP